MDKIIESSISLFNEKGIRFTLDEVATRNSISKKTIYKHYGDKENLIRVAINSIFDSIKERELDILNDHDLNIVEKIKQYLCAFPSYYIRYEHLDQIRETYPELDHLLHEKFTANWDHFESLISSAITHGHLKVIDTQVFKLLMLGLYNEIVENDEKTQIMMINNAVDMILKGYLIT